MSWFSRTLRDPATGAPYQEGAFCTLPPHHGAFKAAMLQNPYLPIHLAYDFEPLPESVYHAPITPEDARSRENELAPKWWVPGDITPEEIKERFRWEVQEHELQDDYAKVSQMPYNNDIKEVVARMKQNMEEIVGSHEVGDEKRKDTGKPGGYYLIPTQPLEELAKLYAMGAAKYSPRGWEAGMEWHRIYDPMMRHIQKWLKGETHDAVDGQHHMAAVAWAAFALMEYERTHPELDDIHPNKDES